MSFETAGYNRRSPMLIGALGRAWLAYCSEEERRTILRGIGARLSPALAALFERIRRDGFAFTQPPRPTRIHGIGVPILGKDRVLGSLSMRFPRSAMSEEVVGRRFGRRLTQVARAIAADSEISD